MITFWVIAAMITTIVMLILVLPILRTSTNSTTANDRTELNVQLTRDRLHDLERDHQQQRIEPAQYQVMKEELKLSLARELESKPVSENLHRSSNQGKWAAFASIMLVPFLAVTLYLNYGDTRAFDESLLTRNKTHQSGNSAQKPSMASIENMVGGLAARLKQNPNDPQGWFMLGRSYMVMGRYGEASDAYAELQKLVGDQASVLLQHAQAKVMNNNGQWDSTTIAMLKKAMTLEPENPVGLSLSGLLAARQGEKELAIKMWRKAQTTMQAASEEYKELDRMIASVSGNAISNTRKTTTDQQIKPNITTVETQTTTTSAHAIEVKVSITPELKEKAGANQTIFIYAQALTGPPMPIAVARKKVSELPLVVTLDDTMAMMPTRKLSSFEKVRIAARISKTGSAMPAAGDLQGKVEPVTTSTTQSVSIIIDHVL